jgi:hypothetical protein
LRDVRAEGGKEGGVAQRRGEDDFHFGEGRLFVDDEFVGGEVLLLRGLFAGLHEGR